MRTPLRAGIAVYNDGHYHAAHDAWEDHWLDLEAGIADERLLHGLIQFTAAVYHAHERNWEGAVGLAESAVEYLDGLDADYQGCNVTEVRQYLGVLASDPAILERRPPIALTHEGTRLALATLEPEALTVAARILAEEWGYDEAVLEAAGRVALTDRKAGLTESPFLDLLYAFVDDERDQAVVYARLSAHLERRRAQNADCAGLFEANESEGDDRKV